MSKGLAAFCGFILAVALVAPASAQIIIGGEPVTTMPGEQPAAVALTFPVDADAAGYTPIRIAAPAFSGANEAETEVATKITEQVRANLASVGIFTAPDAASISTLSVDIGALPTWAEWSGTGVGALVVGKAIISADNSLTIQFRLHDVAARKQVVGTQYRLASVDLWRRIAHKVADDVMVALVGGKGGFDTRLLFVSEQGQSTRLASVDPSGGPAETLLDNVRTLSTPRRSPTSQTVVYSADAPIPGKPNQAQSTTILYDMQAGSRSPLTTQAQPNSDARYSADGRSLIYSRKAGSNTDIYMRNLSTGNETRLTEDKAVDEQPALSPDGTMITFVSNRGNAQAIHVARVDGAPMRCADGAEATSCRLTTEPGEYEAPVWSPRGDWIAYARIVGEDGAIRLVKSDGTEQRTLTTPGRDVLDLNPTWSPDGRRLAFYRVAGSSSAVHVVALAGGQPRKLDLPGDAYEPDWGPKLP